MLKPIHLFIPCLGLFMLSCTQSNTTSSVSTDKTAVDSAKVADTTKIINVLYKCADNKEIRVSYDNTDEKKPFALVQTDVKKPEITKMKLVISASGAKYSDGKLVWWNKGKTGFLTEATGKEKMLVNDCNEYHEMN